MYIHDFLRSRGVWFEALLYQPASSSAKRARNARVTGRRVAKAVLIRAGRFVRSGRLARFLHDRPGPIEPGGGLARLGNPAGDVRTSCWRCFRIASRASSLRSGGSTV